jgi:hypothetical protein
MVTKAQNGRFLHHDCHLCYKNNENQTKHQPTERVPMDITSLIVEAVGGAVGGNVAAD